MKARVAQFYKGDFFVENSILVLSETSIDLSVCVGSIYQGFFTIEGDKNTPVKGILESSCPLLRLKTGEFNSVKTVVKYEFDASFLDVGDNFNEHIKVISDCGEYFIEVKVKVVRPYFDSKMGKIMDLTRFTYLARYNWQQATDIFISDEFPAYILSEDDDYAFIRKQLLKSRSINHALEEFLVATHQKLAVKLSINQTKLFYEVGNEAIADRILITKESWGYIDIDVITDAQFLLIDKDKITSESFVGNSYFLELIILPEKLHKGNNYGKILLKTTYETIEIEVKVVESNDIPRNRSSIELKNQRLNLAKLYLDYRLKNITREKYIASVEESLSNLKLLATKLPEPHILDYCDLFYIQLSILNNEEDKGRKLLDRLSLNSSKWRENNPQLFYGYLALRALYSNEKEAKKTLSILEKYYFGQGRNNPQLLLSLLYLGSSYFEDKKKVLLEISSHFLAGVNSPYLYFEALKILNENPSFLTSLGEFEIQLINFAIKYNYMSRELAFQFVYLASKEKNYNKLIFNALVAIYRHEESLDVLNAICSLLIKGSKRSNAYFEWYKLGVLANLRLAELYEYFMHSIDEEADQPLPQNLLYYFSYSNTLSVYKRAYLYAYVIRHKNENQEVYNSYINNIEEFAIEQLVVGRINSYLALIYKELYKKSKALKDKRMLLLNVAFRHELECNNKNIKGILVAHKEFEKETYIPLHKGKAYLDLYNEKAEIFFIDSQDNIYYRAIDYKVRKLMDINENELLDLGIKEDGPGSITFITYSGLKNSIYDDKSLEARLKLVGLKGIAKEFHENNLLSIISYYYNQSNLIELDNCLEMLEYIPLRSKDKYRLIELLIERKFYHKAYDEIKRYGFNNVSKDKIYDLCTGLIKEGLEREDSLIIMAYYCLINGRHNDYILSYLLKYYLGSCKELFNIWEIAIGYNLDTRDFEAKLLTQILFTQTQEVDSYRAYKSFTRNGISSPLAKAFLNYQAFLYLVRDNSIDKAYFKSMELLVRTDQNDYCILSLLKYYSNLKELEEEQIKFVNRFLDEYIKSGIVLPFFKNFKNKLPLAYDFIHKTFIEVKAHPSSQVYINYKYISGDQIAEEDSYKRERLDHIFGGIFVKSFLLFYGEQVSYSISVVDSKGNFSTSEEKTIELDQDMEINEDNLYNQINLMRLALDSNDGKTFIDTYNNISKTNYVTSKLFKPLL